ncbi:MAG: glycosyltransferase family 4 protein [Patescibacteria group bacterium]|nr:glycosyltransferase family 4 protein [Patescibacteria group bacterium]
MKIALLTATFSKFSGIDRVVEMQAKKLASQGHKVLILTLESDLKLIKDSIKIINLKMPKNIFWQRIYRLLFFLDFKKINKAAELVRDYDKIYSHQYPMNLIALKAKNKFGAKYIYYNHGLAPAETFNNLFEKIYIIIFRFLTNITAKKADQAISISKYLSKILKKETGLESDIIYDTIDKKKFNENLSGHKIRNKYNLNSNPIILYVGRISPHKGIHLLIKAFNKVLKKVPKAHLLIVGKETFSGYSNKLKSLSKKNVHFTGYVSDSDLPLYYAAADIYASASLWEGFNLPLLEAQTCGLPVIVFDIGPHSEVIDKNGILVDKKNIPAFAKALEIGIKK